MPPTVERFGARLAALSYAELLGFAARGCHESAAIRRDADAELAIRTPMPDWAVNKVLLSPDLAPYIFASLDMKDRAAAVVCKAWGAEWKVIRSRRKLCPALSPALDFGLKNPVHLAALPGGKEMAIASIDPERVHIVDKEMQLQRTLGDAASGVTFHGELSGLAAGDHGLYVCEGPGRLLRFDQTFAVAAEYTSNEYDELYDLALAPGGLLFALVADEEATVELLALDALSLEVRFTVGKGEDSEDLGGGVLKGLTVCGDELYVGNLYDHSIRVFSLDGKPRRVISSPPGGWRMPGQLCCVADRLYLIEALERPSDDEEEAGAIRLTTRRIFVLTPEGRTLQVYTSPRPLEENSWWRGMCHFDGKLMVADYWRDKVLALQEGL